MAYFDGTYEPEDNGRRQPMRPPRQASNMGLMIFLGVCLIVVTVATMRWVDHTGAPQASQVETIPLTPPDEAYAATPPAPVETEDPEVVARGRQLAMQPAVRQQMCTNYAKRYHSAKTSLDLQRSIQLSQAAGCGWQAIFNTDAPTHDLSPEALAVALGIEAENVPTLGTFMADQEEKIDAIDSKVSEMKRTVEDIKWKVR